MTPRDKKLHEQLQKKVDLETFYIGQVPVTNDIFELFIRETGYETEAEQNANDDDTI